MMDCKTCKEGRPADVPYIVHESAMMRADKHLKRVIVALIIAIILLFVSNGAWLWAWSNYDYSSYELDGEGVNIIGNTNEVRNFERQIQSPPEEERQG